MALVQLNAGNIDAALEYLDIVLYNPYSVSTVTIEADPLWESARNHERYKALMKKYDGITF